MALRAETSDGFKERCVLIGMITSKIVLGQIASRWSDHMFASPEAQAIAFLCVEFFQKHNDAPGRTITALWEDWAEHQASPPRGRMVASLLQSLSDEYQELAEGVNPAHTIDLAGRYFREVSLQRLQEGIEVALEKGDVERADDLVTSHRRVELGIGSGVDLFWLKEEVTAVFAEEGSDCLVHYDGALGAFFGETFCRDAFVAFLGPEKSGKSFWLLDVAWRALLSRRRVAYFEAGDLSKRQVESRFLIRAAQRPSRSTNPDGSFPCEVKYPRHIRVEKDVENGRRFAEVDYEIKTKGRLSFDTAWKACERLTRTRLNSRRSHFKLHCFPNSTLTVGMISSQLEDYTNLGWVPDLVVIDYADILAPPPGRMEIRDQINTNWKQLRTISQENHCLVLTATQSDAAGYGSAGLSRKNFSEDKRKLSHVTGMVGINVSDEDKERGVQRLNWIVRRDGDFNSKRFVWTAPCLALANPAVLSAD